MIETNEKNEMGVRANELHSVLVFKQNHANKLEIKILSIPCIIPIGKMRWKLLNHDSKTHYMVDQFVDDADELPQIDKESSISGSNDD